MKMGRDKLFYYILNNTPNMHKVKKSDIEEYLKRNQVHVINSRQYKTKEIKSYDAKYPLHILQMDLIDYSKKPARQFNYILVVLDLFSRFVWTFALTKKQPDKVLAAFMKINFDRKPKKIVSDNGSEFLAEFQQYLKKEGIKHVFTNPHSPFQNGNVERFNGTYKKLLEGNKMTSGKTWVDYMKDMTKLYNSNVHSSTGFPPKIALKAQVNDEVFENIREKQEKRNANKEDVNREAVFNVGDKVRLKVPKGKLGKHSVNNFTRELYVVKNIR
ncbi:unnamed protein product, partial [Heterosigma akashiwo]